MDQNQYQKVYFWFWLADRWKNDANSFWENLNIVVGRQKYEKKVKYFYRTTFTMKYYDSYSGICWVSAACYMQSDNYGIF